MRALRLAALCWLMLPSFAVSAAEPPQRDWEAVKQVGQATAETRNSGEAFRDCIHGSSRSGCCQRGAMAT